MAEHLVVACLLDVEDLAAQGKNRLEAAVAALLGGAACRLTLDEVDFAALRIALGAVGQLAGQTTGIECALAAGQVTGLARGLAGTRCLDGLVDDALGDRRVLLKEGAKPLVDEGLHGAGDVGVELALGLAFELRLRQLHADDCDQALAHIVAAQVLLHVLEETELLADGVDGAGQRGAEAGQMRAAIHRIDVVREAEDRLRIGVVVLEGDLDGDAVAHGLHDDRLVMQHGLAAIQMLDELGNAASVAELAVTRLAGLGVGGALVGERDNQALVEEGHLAQTLRQRVVVVLGDREDRLVGQEVNLGATALGRADLAQLADRIAATEVHLPGVAVAADLDVELLRERVDATDADAVQTARDLVGRGIKLAAGMQNGEHDLNGRHLLAIGQSLHIDRDATAIVNNGHRVVDMDDDVNPRRVTGQRLVDRVVDHLINKVMQAHLAGRADIHGRPETNCLKAFEDLDVFARVAVVIAVVVMCSRA